MVLHVTGALDGIVAVITLEFAEDLGVGLTGDVGEHIKASAVRHADGDFEDVVVRGVGEDFVEQRNQ